MGEALFKPGCIVQLKVNPAQHVMILGTDKVVFELDGDGGMHPAYTTRCMDGKIERYAAFELEPVGDK